MKRCTSLVAFVAGSMWISACGGQPTATTTTAAAKEPLGPTEAELYEQRLTARIAAGDEPPNRMKDPIDDSEAYRNWSLYFCENLTEPRKSRPCAGDPCTVEELVSPSLGAICQNTVAGEQLLELRKWKCGEFATPECICDGKKGIRFDNKQAYLIKRFGGALPGRDGIVLTPCRISE